MGNLRDHRKISVALISTYDDMTKTFVMLAEQEGLNPYIASATLEKAAAIAKEISPTTDVIISRGGTAEYIKKVVDIPVVSVPITSFDAIRSIYEVKDRFDELAFFNYRDKMYGIRDIEKMFSIKIHEYIFVSEQDIEDGLRDAKSKGLKIAIGGIIIKNLAAAYGLEGKLIKSGEEAVYLSVREAVHLAQVRLIEQSRAARIKGVLDSIAEGIIVTDEQNQVVMYNPAAEKIFKIPCEQVIGQAVQTVIPNTRMHNVFETGEPEMAVLQKIHGGNIATNRIPLVFDEKIIGVVSTFEDVTAIQRLEQQIRKQMHVKGFVAKNSFEDILTVNSAMQEVKELAALYSTTDSSVLIEGESGTGKELFAQSVHNASRRSAGPFVAVNCAAIPEHLLESELFGYEGGAFTGARKEGKQGLFELAHKGTIFLDEIGEIPQSLQARLLRVLQEKEIMRVGGDKILPVDIRIISATNKDLEKRVSQGEFRDDLYYRLNVFNLKIPPLRERKEDIFLLAKAFLSKTDSRINLDGADRAIKNMLLSYDWPGNIRELQNVMERLALLASRPLGELRWAEMLHKVMLTPAVDDMTITIRVDVGRGLKPAINHVEKTIIGIMMARCEQNQDIVAKKLGIGRTSLWRKGKD
ncbi:sigma 54-interacting transcriptional regulator [Sporomusa malonica]|uniref:PAS domain S-box-containing protein n=1 Tax=Sporomusa malonica TaxID=112901 RepID=A0A1W2D7R1_9FIRM|nr:sigma 54-interacting transcriptional regulator [Sporomusa malonica]SMC93226.1 PAS domain S-box-containing protein [Sporomusa malonica]